MQRPQYSAPLPAHSPPLHHPVPQHVSTVPQLRSPPPPSISNNQQSSYGGYGQQQQGSDGAGGGSTGSYGHPAFGNFINDPTAQMGLQMGQSALKVGGEYVEQNLNRYLNVPALKHYFNVSNAYVLRKTLLVIFPWRHRPWSRTTSSSHSPSSSSSASSSGPTFAPPREDINAPDMYIPLMAFVTYILLSTLIAGLNGTFEPQLLGITFSNASIIILLEIAFLKLAQYFLNISSTSQIYDLVAYAGYKFVGVIVTIAMAAAFNRGKGTGGWVGWGVFGYTYLANSFFLLRSLKYVLLPPSSTDVPGAPSSMQTLARSQRSRRTQFLFGYSYVVQLGFMWWLSALKVGDVPGR